MPRFLGPNATEEEKKALDRKWENFFKDMRRHDVEKTLAVIDGPLFYSLDREDKTASVSCREPEGCYEALMKSRVDVNGEEFIVNLITMMAFRDCVNLVKVEFPKTVDRILRGTFWDCLKLEYIHIPSNIRLLLPCSFFNCPELKRVEFEDLNGMEIQEEAFVDCHPEIKFYDKTGDKEYSKGDFINSFCKKSQ